MLLLGHIGITAFIGSMIYLPILGVVIGVLLPDVIDKSLFLLGAPCGRFIAHSIFFFPVAGLVTYALTRNKKFALAVALGSLLHLLEDMHHYMPLLYPFKDYAFFDICATFQLTFTSFVISTEIIGALLLVFVIGFSRRFIDFRSKVWDFIRKIKNR